MSRYADTIRDQYERPIAEAKIYVYGQDEQLAVLTEDGGGALTNPVSSDSYGAFHFNAADGLYQLRYVVGGKQVLIQEGVAVGAGPQLPSEIVIALAQPGRAAFIGTTDGGNVQAELNKIGNITHPGFPAIVSTLGDLVPTVASSISMGIRSNGVDDTVALQAAIDYLSAATLNDSRGRTLVMKPGATTVTSGQIVVKPGVSLDLRGGRLVSNLAGGDGGALRMLSRTGVRNGRIDVSSTGNPGIQVGIHSPILIGAIYGQGGTVTARSAFDRVSQVDLENLILYSNKAYVEGQVWGALGVGIIGEVSHVRGRGIEISSNAFMAGAISIDWGIVGEDPTRSGPLLTQYGTQAIVSADNMLTLAKAQYNLWLSSGGTQGGFTTHPSDISFIGVKVGALTKAYGGTADTGSFIARMSGVHRCLLQDITGESATEYGFHHTAGDLGYEFARPADYALALKGNELSRCTLRGGTTAKAMVIDSLADNVLRALTTNQRIADGTTSATPYTALRPTLIRTDVKVNSPHGYSTGGAAAGYGIELNGLDGGEVVAPVMEGFKNGLRTSGARNTVISRASLRKSWHQNILVEDASKRLIFRDTAACEYANQAGAGSGVTRANVYIGSSDGVTIDGGVFGADASDETAFFGIATGHAGDGVTNITIRGRPKVNSHSAGGVAFSIGSGGIFGTLWLLAGGYETGSYVTTTWSGTDCIPVQRDTRSEYRTFSSNTLVGLPVKQGDLIWFDDAVAGGAPGRGAVGTGTISGANLNTLTRTMPALA